METGKDIDIDQYKWNLEAWAQPGTVVKIDAYHANTAQYRQRWGVITKVIKLDTPRFIFTPENIKESIFYFDPVREPFISFDKNVLSRLPREERGKYLEKHINTPEQALEDSKQLGLAEVELEVVVAEEKEGSYSKIRLYDVEVKWPIASLTENFLGVTDEQIEAEVKPFIEDVMAIEADLQLI